MRKEQVVRGLKVVFKDGCNTDYLNSHQVERMISDLDAGKYVCTITSEAVFTAYLENKCSAYRKSHKNCVRLERDGEEVVLGGDNRIPIRELMTVEEQRAQLVDSLEYKRQNELYQAQREELKKSFAYKVGQLAEAYGLEIGQYDIHQDRVSIRKQDVEKLLEFARTYVYPNSNKFK